MELRWIKIIFKLLIYVIVIGDLGFNKVLILDFDVSGIIVIFIFLFICCMMVFL